MIFIFGTQKSGTTWLRNVIANFSAVSEAYEWQVPRLVALIHDHIKFCGVARPQTEIQKKSLIASRNTIESLIASEGLEIATDKSAYPSLAAASRNDAIYAYHVSLVRRLYPRAKNIQIVRDPRDVLVSSKHYFGLTEISQDECAAFADSWSRCNLRWLTDQPDMVLRYEDLKYDFEKTVGKIKESILGSSKYEDTHSLVERFGSIDYSQSIDPIFYRKGVVGEWRESLSKSETQTIENHAGFVMGVFGYE